LDLSTPRVDNPNLNLSPQTNCLDVDFLGIFSTKSCEASPSNSKIKNKPDQSSSSSSSAEKNCTNISTPKKSQSCSRESISPSMLFPLTSSLLDKDQFEANQKSNHSLVSSGTLTFPTTSKHKQNFQPLTRPKTLFKSSDETQTLKQSDFQELISLLTQTKSPENLDCSVSQENSSNLSAKNTAKDNVDQLPNLDTPLLETESPLI